MPVSPTERDYPQWRRRTAFASDHSSNDLHGHPLVLAFEIVIRTYGHLNGEGEEPKRDEKRAVFM
jgi:hypothetical protein